MNGPEHTAEKDVLASEGAGGLSEASIHAATEVLGRLNREAVAGFTQGDVRGVAVAVLMAAAKPGMEPCVEFGEHPVGKHAETARTARSGSDE